MTKENSTLIAVILDRSGSMETVWDDTIGGFNVFMDEQKKAPGACAVTLTQFDDVYEVVYNDRPIAEVPKLTRKTYIPRNSTALVDAVGKTIVEVGAALETRPDAERPNKVIVCIITDGKENASKEYTRSRISEMIHHQMDKYGWEFTYLGANVDAFEEARGLGIRASAAANYASRKVGAAFKGVSSSVARARSTGEEMSYTESERTAMTDDDEDEDSPGA